MSETNQAFSIGVEEEYQLVDPDTRQLCSNAQAVLPKARASVGDQVTPELYRSQIEIGTSVCQSLAQVREELTHLRRELLAAAEQKNCRIVAAGTHPFSHWEDQQLTNKARYMALATDYQQLAREQLIFGCHVHVGIPNREMAIQVMNRTRPWLPTLLALAANSPFWLGTDTGYASFRTEIWGRWPTAGMPQPFASRADFDRLVDELTALGVIEDATKIYWDMRPSTHFETLEFRVTDVCLTVDEAVMIAGLCRALARTAADEADRNDPLPTVRAEVLEAAKWQAARFGLEQTLFDPTTGGASPAGEVVENLLTHVRPALEQYGEWDEVSKLVRNVVNEGTGSARQRAVYNQVSRLEDVVDFMVAETGRGL